MILPLTCIYCLQNDGAHYVIHLMQIETDQHSHNPLTDANNEKRMEQTENQGD